MQFSLKQLILLTALVAIGVSFSLQVLAIRGDEAATIALQTQFKQKQQNANLFSAQNATLILANLRMKKQIDDHQDLRNQIATIFADTVAPESKITPKPGLISLREIPLLDRRDSLHKKFAISIPENRKLRLMLQLSTDQSEIADSTRDFEPIEKTSFPLPPGQHIVDFFFGSSTDDGNEKTGPLVVRVTIDGQVVLETRFTPDKSNGSSCAIYNYSQQKDYGPKAKLPQLIDFKPLPGKTHLNLVLEDMP